MTRKDYVLIAEALVRSRPFGNDHSMVVTSAYLIEQWQRDRQQIMDVLARDNPRFDRGRFIEATEK